MESREAPCRTCSSGIGKQLTEAHDQPRTVIEVCNVACPAKFPQARASHFDGSLAVQQRRPLGNQGLHFGLGWTFEQLKKLPYPGDNETNFLLVKPPSCPPSPPEPADKTTPEAPTRAGIALATGSMESRRQHVVQMIGQAAKSGTLNRVIVRLKHGPRVRRITTPMHGALGLSTQAVELQNRLAIQKDPHGALLLWPRPPQFPPVPANVNVLRVQFRQIENFAKGHRDDAGVSCSALIRDEAVRRLELNVAAVADATQVISRTRTPNAKRTSCPERLYLDMDAGRYAAPSTTAANPAGCADAL
jgi:hypothetical protein